MPRYGARQATTQFNAGDGSCTATSSATGASHGESIRSSSLSSHRVSRLTAATCAVVRRRALGRVVGFAPNVTRDCQNQFIDFRLAQSGERQDLSDAEHANRRIAPRRKALALEQERPARPCDQRVRAPRPFRSTGCGGWWGRSWLSVRAIGMRRYS